MNTQNQHKNITRVQFVKSVNPEVLKRLKEICDELRRKESGHG